MGRQSADFGIQLFKLALMRRLQSTRGCMIRFEQTRESFERFRFPGAQLVGMHAALGSDAGHALFFFQDFEDDLGLKGG